jgi:hypothetical protein
VAFLQLFLVALICLFYYSYFGKKSRESYKKGPVVFLMMHICLLPIEILTYIFAAIYEVGFQKKNLFVRLLPLQGPVGDLRSLHLMHSGRIWLASRHSSYACLKMSEGALLSKGDHEYCG